jgi:hypothetical protein
MKDRLLRERETLRAMVALYCRDRHRPPAGICASCQDLLAYAEQRLAACPFGVEKPTCARCPIHCYRPLRRRQVREVMRHAGPRLLLHRPWLALLHLRDRLQKVPERPARGGRPPGGEGKP